MNIARARTVRFLALCVALRSAAQGEGTQSPLMLGSGARALAMGRAATAVTEEADALFWNPARLSQLDRMELSLFHTQLYTDQVQLNSAHFVFPTLAAGSFALGVQTLGVGGIERRDERNALLGSFDDRESHFSLGYAKGIQSNYAVGAALRVEQQRVADVSAVGVGLDLAAHMTRALDAESRHTVLAGINVQNFLEPSLRLEEDSVHDPRVLRVGLGYQGLSSALPLDWTLATDLELPREADVTLGAGLEISYRRLLRLRCGLEDGDPAFGFGIESHGVRVDYAMRTHDELDRNDRFSLAVRFGLSVEERKAVQRQEAELRVETELNDRLAERERQAAEASMHEAEAAVAQRDYEAARRHYRRVLALEPDHEGALRGLDAAEHAQLSEQADGALAEHRYADAVTDYTAILRRWPEDASATRGLEAARQSLRAAADREAQLAELLRLAVTHFAEGSLEAAEASLHELLRLSPEHEVARELLARIDGLREGRLAEERRRERERDELAAKERKLPPTRPEIEPKPTARAPLSPEAERRLREQFDEGLRRFSAGDFQAAIDIWQRVWNERRDFESVSEYLVKAYLFEGIQLYSAGEYAAAIDRCRRILEIDPKNAKARRYLERIREEQEEVEALGAKR
jgi:tetratricopeptide (TPR) repeat protein